MWGQGEGRVCEVEQWVREMKQGVGYTHSRGGSNIDMVAAAMSESRSNVESTEGVAVPRLADQWCDMSVAELASRVDGVSTKVTGFAIQAMVSRDRAIRLGGLQVVKSQFNERDETVPKVQGESNMNRSEGRNNMVFGGSDMALGRVSTMIIGWNELNRAIYIGGCEKRTHDC